MYADTYLSVIGQKNISQALKRLYSMKLYHTGQVLCYIRLALQLFFQKVITLCFSVIIKILPSLVKRRVCPFLFSGSDLFNFAVCLVACFHLFSALLFLPIRCPTFLVSLHVFQSNWLAGQAQGHRVALQPYVNEVERDS